MRLLDCFSPLISLALHNQTESDAQEIKNLHGHLMSFVEQSRCVCEEQGYTKTESDSALFAVISWIDERNLCNLNMGHIWVHFQLQKTLFNTTSAGDEFFDRFEMIAEQDSELLDVYLTCLSLGFRGKLYDDKELFDEFCLANLGCLMADLTKLIPGPLFAQGYDSAKKKRRGMKDFQSSTLRSFMLFLASVALLGGMFFLGQYSLASLYLSLNFMGQ